MYRVNILCMQRAFVRTTKSTLWLHNAQYNTATKHLAQAYIFEYELYPTTAVQQTQHVDAVGCPTFSSGLISMFVFDILQIPSRCIQICSGFIAPTCSPLAMDLLNLPPPPHMKPPVAIRYDFQWIPQLVRKLWRKKEKSLPPPRIKTRSFALQTRYYIDWELPAHPCKV
jgi:hypothetical protein